MAYKDRYQMSDSQVGLPPISLCSPRMQGESSGLGVQGLKSAHASRCPLLSAPERTRGGGVVLHTQRTKLGFESPGEGAGGIGPHCVKVLAAPSWAEEDLAVGRPGDVRVVYHPSVTVLGEHSPCLRGLYMTRLQLCKEAQASEV